MDPNTATVWIAAIAALSSIVSLIITGLLAYLARRAASAALVEARATHQQAAATHTIVNSRFSELLELTKKLAIAEGQASGKAEAEGQAVAKAAGVEEGRAAVDRRKPQ